MSFSLHSRPKHCWALLAAFLLLANAGNAAAKGFFEIVAGGEGRRVDKQVERSSKDAVRYATNPGALVYDIAFKDTVEEADARANATLSRHTAIVNELLKEHQHVLAGTLLNATQDLADATSGQLADLNLMLSAGTHQLNALAHVQRIRALGAIQLIGIGAFCLVTLSAASLSWAASNQRPTRSRAILVVAGWIVFSTLLVGLSITWRVWSEADLVDGYESQLTAALSELNLDGVVQNAAALDVLAENSTVAQEVTDFSQTLRTGLTKATAYKTRTGLAQIQGTLERLNSQYFRRCGNWNPYVDSLLALLLWQTAPSRAVEHRAAGYAARALSSGERSPRGSWDSGVCLPTPSPSNFSMFTLAYHYLANYLLHPLASEEFAALEPRSSDSTALLVDAYNQASLQLAHSSETLDLIDPVVAFTAYGVIARQTLRSVIPAYVVMAYAHARQSAVSDKALQQHYALAGWAAARKILETYDGLEGEDPPSGIVAALSKPLFGPTAARENFLMAGHGMYYRAFELAAGAPPELAASTNEAKSAFIQVMNEFVGKTPDAWRSAGAAPAFKFPDTKKPPVKLADFQKENLPSCERQIGIRIVQQQLASTLQEYEQELLEKLAHQSLLNDLDRLEAFEVALNAYVKNTTAQNGTQVMSAEAPIGLFLCRDSDYDNLCEPGQVEKFSLPRTLAVAAGGAVDPKALVKIQKTRSSHRYSTLR